MLLVRELMLMLMLMLLYDFPPLFRLDFGGFFHRRTAATAAAAATAGAGRQGALFGMRGYAAFGF